jgi:hypothetical protein
VEDGIAAVVKASGPERCHVKFEMDAAAQSRFVAKFARAAQGRPILPQA